MTHVLIALLTGGIFVLAFLLKLRQLRARARLQENFSRALIQSQEDERKRLANDLHDSLGHDLLVLKSDLERGSTQRGDVSQRLLEWSGKAGEAVQQVREISHNLRPPELERFGLGPALESIARSTEAATGIHIDSDIEESPERLRPEVELGLFRIAQEALSNMAKHSDASEGRVVLRRDGDLVVLVVEDDGRGFEMPGTDVSASGLGISGMEERARLLGGRMECVSRRTKGARVTVSVPTAPHE